MSDRFVVRSITGWSILLLAARLNREAEALERGEPLPRGTGPVLRRWAL